jgi:hypothetical protein
MLTKSDIQSFRQCPRRLWLEHHEPESASSDNTQAARRERDGELVGAMAREILGNSVLWPRSDADKATAAAMALQELAANPERPAVEVPLVFGDVYARTDALLPINGFPGRYVLQETKASSFPLKEDKVTPSKPESHQLDDISIQSWVLKNSSLEMERAELNLLDGQWRYPGNGDYSGLFRTMDVTEIVAQRIAEVPNWVASARATIELREIPPASTGPQCKKPHECPFKEKCVAMEPPAPAHPLTLLPDMAGKCLAKKLAAAGHTSLLSPDSSLLVGGEPGRTALYQRIQSAHKTGKFVLRPEARSAIDGLGYPRTYFDFEGIDLAVPLWQGVRPYEQLTFQFSCHIQRFPNGPFEHHSFLDLSGDDPSLPCIEAMRKAIPSGNGPIIVYFEQYEKSRIKELATRHPEHAALLGGFVDRLVDLLPLVKDNFYSPVMEGSFSIKKVLKAIAPHLDYSLLSGVQEGVGAQLAYLEAIDVKTSAARRAEIEEQLVAYCRQDTWAMVLVAYFLARRPAPDMPGSVGQLELPGMAMLPVGATAAAGQPTSTSLPHCFMAKSIAGRLGSTAIGC